MDAKDIDEQIINLMQSKESDQRNGGMKQMKGIAWMTDLVIKLSTTDYMGKYPMLWLGVGVSVGSQISTIMHHLPQLP